jgi:hypothetical protein
MLRVIATVGETDEGINIQRIARDYLKRVLKSDMEERVACANRPVYNMSYDEGASATADLEWVEAELKTAKTELRERLYGHQRPLIDEIMNDNAVPPGHRDALAHAVLQARVEIWETIYKRTQGDFSSRPEEPLRAVRYSRVRRSALGGRVGVTVRFTVRGATSLRCDLAMWDAGPVGMTVRTMALLRTVRQARPKYESGAASDTAVPQRWS